MHTLDGVMEPHSCEIPRRKTTAVVRDVIAQM